MYDSRQVSSTACKRRGTRMGLVPALVLTLTLGLSPAAGAGIMGHYFDFPTSPFPHMDTQNSAINTGQQFGLVNSTLLGDFPTLTALGQTKYRDFNWWGQVPGFLPVVHQFDRVDTNLDFSAYGVKWFPTDNRPVPYKAFAAYWSGCLMVDQTSSYTLPVWSDDDFWLFIDGQLVLDNGGLHNTQYTSNTITLSLGDHKFDAFYANRHTGEASLQLKLPTGMHYEEGPCPNHEPIPPTAIPEPGTLMLLGTGLTALPLLRRIRK